MLWDLFCRVIDNHGDIGVCWRLAADLAGRGESVRLWTDDRSALAWMAPRGAPGVAVFDWPRTHETPMPGDVVIEAFGCDPPAAFVQAMAAAEPPPRWINLEYLSAEPYVARSHGLPSPQPCGLVKRFYYPGFDLASGGLLREPDLPARRAAFDAAAWLRANGLERRPGERVVSLFCYDNPALDALLDLLAGEPTLLLVAFGHAERQVRRLLGPRLARGALRAVLLAPLEQVDFDHLLWACDLNFVRGEDSLVRAIWAGRPFVWQLYPQHDGAHAAKLTGFIERLTAGAPADLRSCLADLFGGWNGLDPLPAVLPPQAAWDRVVGGFRDRLLAQPDLGSGLRRFATERP